MKSKKINSKPASITDISSKGSISNLRIPSSSVISGPLPSASGVYIIIFLMLKKQVVIL